MKKLIIILILGFYTPVFSQTFDFDELRTPTSPGFILSDQTPSSIDRPTTPQGVAVSIISLQQGGAFEIAPFWLTNHIKYKFENLAFNKVPVRETFSLSVSSNRSDTLSFLSFGARVQLLKFWSSAHKTEVNTLKEEILTLLDEDMTPELAASIKEKSKKLSSLIQKPTFVLEAAGAILGSSEENSFDNLRRSRARIWVNLNVNPSVKLPLSIIGLVRYVDNPYFGEYPQDSKIFDYGLRLMYGFSRLSISGEYIQRIETDKNNNYNRLAAIAEYKIVEGFYATATFGKNYNDISNIIALVGINFGISRKPNVNF